MAEGSGVELDAKKAVEFFRKAIRQGNVPAMFHLLKMTMRGSARTRTGSKPAPSSAWTQASATKGKVILAAHMYMSKQVEKERDLPVAVEDGNAGAVEEFLDSDVDANAIDDDGRTNMIIPAWRAIFAYSALAGCRGGYQCGG